MIGTSEQFLAVDGITAGYGGISAVREASLHVSQREVVAIIGANGAGKTTLMRAISRGIALKSGKINFAGKDLGPLKAHHVVELGLVHVPEGRQIFPRMNVRENLELGAFLALSKPEKMRRLQRVYEIFPILAERRRQLGCLLSGGEQQMLAIGRALMAGPKMMLLDEPSMGIAPKLVETIFEILLDLRKREGIALLVVEQNAHLALNIADRAYLLETGAIVLSGSGAEMRGNPLVAKAYLGEAAV